MNKVGLRMKQYCFSCTLLLSIAYTLLFAHQGGEQEAWIRINQLGYKPTSVKAAVWCSKNEMLVTRWQLIDAATKKIATSGIMGKALGAYGPFNKTYRINFSKFQKPGKYYLQAGGVKSPEFDINDNVYKGAADFCLRYMRQQRSGYNPFLRDSCHTHDGYALYGSEAALPDSTHIDVSGGWHDASDYLQYSTTTANATYHLLMAYRDFPGAFIDEKLANGLDGTNGLPDVLDEAKWGIDWLLKMHPQPNLMFNQLGDDRDHISMRIPKMDSQYGKGYERPVYFINGKPQQRGRFLNNTTGTSSTAGKFAAAFALAHSLYETDTLFRKSDRRKGYADKAFSAYHFAGRIPGVTQTASVKAPYIYAEDNWTDDMELAAAALQNMNIVTRNPGNNIHFDSFAYLFAKEEPLTPWFGKDTAHHYQWYPFVNIGHYELAKQLNDHRRDTIIGYYREGIERVWNKAKENAFYRGIPFIWCSNNLTTSFAIQCYWYRQLTNDKRFEELEQANFDWLFGCNPWGTSMVYGLPAKGDTPADPHSAFTHLKNYPIDGGLVDGPVYGSIYKNLIGIRLYNEDEYAAFQSGLAVYHDDYGDYSTNEPTMDGTASLIYLLAAKEAVSPAATSIKEGSSFQEKFGAIIRGDSNTKKIALVFTGHEFAEGGNFIADALQNEKIKASFFFTGDFYRNPSFAGLIKKLNRQGHYIGPHSDKHLLYCDWNDRARLLVSKEEFVSDISANYAAMNKHGITNVNARFFLPPYEWYNDSIAAWTKEMGVTLINYTPGTTSHADYTTETDKNFRSSEAIYQSITDYEAKNKAGLNGFILLMHTGAGPMRKDKFYYQLPQLLKYLKKEGYHFQRIDDLLSAKGDRH